MKIQLVLACAITFCLSTMASEAFAQGGRYGGGVVAPGTPMITLTGQSGGPREARNMGSNCRGNIATTPDHIFNVVAPMTVRFEVVNAGGDTTMVLVGPSGVICDDDGGNGTNPRIIRHLVPGQYQVYVGTYSGRNRFLPYTIQVNAHGPAVAPPVAVAPPTVTVQGGALHGVATLAPHQMVATLGGVSGFNPHGQVFPANRYGSQCRGHISAQPNHIITVVTPMVVTFDVNAPGDTTLVIINQNNTVVGCDDDSGNGNNPRLTRPLSPGIYRIYVGSYSRGTTHRYSLSIHP